VSRFRNLEPTGRRGGALLLRWMVRRQPARWPSHIENLPWPPPGPVPPRHAGVTSVGHSTFLLRMAAVTILTDPQFSERASPVGWAGPRRVRAPGIMIGALPPLDLILVSHNHYDHMDLPSLRALQGSGAQIVTSSGNAAALAQAGIPGAQELGWWETATIGRARVTATPAQHFSRRGLFDRDRTLWAGFMVETEEGRVFFAGDSGAGGHWAEIREKLGAPSLALLPIGAYAPRAIMAPVHMDPAEAVAAHLALSARRSIGMHWGTFQLTDEGIDDPPQALAAARDAAGLLRERFDVLDVGETRNMPLD